MIKITRDDIQKIYDESSLMKFLKERLNLPIPEGLNLEEITSNFSNFSLGFSGYMADQVLDCQEISISSGKPSGIFIIRCKGEAQHSLILRNIAKSLSHWGRNPADLRFICVDRHFQPTAFACFKDFEAEGEWHSIVLNIFQWTQDNTFINICSEHEIPDTFFPDVFTDKPDDESKNHGDASISTEDLLEKVENIGTPLSEYWEIHKGISKGSNKAFVVDETKRQELIREAPKSAEIIKPCIGKHQKSRWKPILRHLIWIPSSEIKRWQWSGARNESEAEKIFTQVYPAISNHLYKFEIDIKSRYASCKGKFYWEHSPPEHHPEFLGPKIIFYDKPPILAFYDVSDAIVVNPFVHSIQTSDLSLLAILNSKLFEWYAHTKYPKKGGGRLNKTNMKDFPIAGTEAQKKVILPLVQQILDNSDSPEVTALEAKINQLIYELYELTPKEVKLIEEESNK